MIKLNGEIVEIEIFPNNEIKVTDFEKNIKQNENNIFELKYETDTDLIALMFAKQRIDEITDKSILFIWYMPYSRMDRKIEGDLFTLQYVCNFINWLNFKNVIVMEPHSEKTMMLLQRALDIYPAKDWLEQIKKEIGFRDGFDHIVFPDKGAAARYIDNKYSNICIMEKKRNPYTRIIEDMYLKEGQVNKDSKCIIIDDLCAKGSTSYRAGNILKDKGAKEVVLVVSHCEEVVLKGKLLSDDSPISKLYSSKSIMSIEHPHINYMDVNVLEYVEKLCL